MKNEHKISMVKLAHTLAGIAPACRHLTGYWINRQQRNFRCYGCQGQFHIGDNLPADHPTGGIELWQGQYRRGGRA